MHRIFKIGQAPGDHLSRRACVVVNDENPLAEADSALFREPTLRPSPASLL